MITLIVKQVTCHEGSSGRRASSKTKTGESAAEAVKVDLYAQNLLVRRRAECAAGAAHRSAWYCCLVITPAKHVPRHHAEVQLSNGKRRRMVVSGTH